jgi:integrase
MRKETLPRGIHRRNGSLVISYSVAGKVRYQSLGDCSLESAKDQLLLTKLEIRKGTWKPKQSCVPEPVAVVYTVKDLWEPYFRRYRNDGGKDEGRLQIAWNHLKPTFEDVPVSGVSTALIDEYVESRRRIGIKNGTINRELTTLAAMFRLGERSTTANGQPMIARLPAFPSKLEEGKPRKGFIKDAQFAVLASNAKNPWLRAFIECAYSFGFRRGELLGLRKRQIDFMDGWIHLEDTKSGEPRQVKMSTKVRELLVVLVRGKEDNDPVFTRPDGGRVVDMRQDWYDLCIASKLGRYVTAKRKNGEDYERYEGLNVHDFRRSAIRNMTRRGVTEKVAMTISGHTTRSVFDRYNIVDETDLAQATEKIEAGRETAIPAARTQTKLKHAVLAVL